MNKLAVLQSMRKNLSPMLQSNREVRSLLIHLVNNAEDPELLKNAQEQLKNAVKVLDSNEFLFKNLIGD